MSDDAALSVDLVSTSHDGGESVVEQLAVPEPKYSRKRRTGLVIAATFVLIGIVAGGTMLAKRLKTSAEGPLVGHAAPSFTLPALAAGEPDVSLGAFRGRPLVINVWASWCVPCRREMPDFQAAHVLLGDRVAFVGIDHQDARSSAIAFAHETGVTYPSGFDPQGAVAADYGLVGLPTTILVASDGRIVAEVKGALTREKLLKLVSDRLNVTVT